MKTELEQYRVEPDTFWQALPVMGVSGYDAIEFAEWRKWKVVPSWGRDGYDLGSWPLVIVFFRNREERFDIAYYVEGDVVMYACPTQDIRNQIVDAIAFFHWNWEGANWVQGIESVDELPEELKGPYRPREAERQ